MLSTSSLSEGEKILSASGFIKEMKEALEDGYHFVPLLGSGISQPSGVPTGAGLGKYLAYCIYRTLGLWQQSPGEPKFWNPRKDPWADVRSLDHVSHIAAAEEEMARRLNPVEKPDQSGQQAATPASAALTLEEAEHQRLCRQAYGALADWRAALQFLSRIEPPDSDSGKSDGSLTLGPPDDSVIDKFFRTIVHGCRPNLAHMLIAGMARRLRIELILTTNFDELIEASFAEVGSELIRFDVHRDAGLPSSQLIITQRSLVKLHGGRYGLRADFSLDAKPTDKDLESFIAYLTRDPFWYSGGVNLNEGNADDGNTMPALLVAGLSARDRRIVEFIEHALKTLKSLKVFWVCHTDQDLEYVRQTRLGVYHERLVIVKHANLGILMLELQQALSGSLPSTGLPFPTVWNLPFPPRFIPSRPGREKTAIHEKSSKELKASLKERIREGLKPRKRAKAGQPSPIELPSVGFIHVKCKKDAPQTVFGAPFVASEVFWENENNATQLWIDLDGIADPSSMFVRLLAASAHQTGRPMPAQPNRFETLTTLHEDDDPTEKLYLDLLKSTIDPSSNGYVVFLNAINAPGATADVGNASERWHKPEVFARTCELFAKIRETFSPVPWVWVLIEEAGWRFELPANFGGKPIPVTNPAIPFTIKDAVADALAWLEMDNDDHSKEGKTAFLHILISFRLARYKASIAKAFELWLEHCATPECRGNAVSNWGSSYINTWIDYLKEYEIVRDKNGGLIWLNVAVREDIRKAIEGRVPPAHCMAIEGFIARCYGRILLASNDPMAAFECLRHVSNAMDIASEGKMSDDQMLASIILHGAQVLNVAKDLIIKEVTEPYAPVQLKSLFDSCITWIETAVKKNDSQSPTSETTAALLSFVSQLVEAQERSFEVQGGNPVHVLKRLADLMDHLKKLKDSCPLDAGDSIHQVLLQSIGKVLRQSKLSRAVILLCGRYYDAASKMFVELLQEEGFYKAANESSSMALKPGAFLSEQALTSLLPHNVAASLGDIKRGENLSFYVRLVRRCMYCSMHGGHIRILTDGRPIPKSKKGLANPEDYFLQAAWLAKFGLALLREAGDRASGMLGYENARIRSHFALVEGRLASLKKEDNDPPEHFAAAEVLFSDAEAFLEAASPNSCTLTRAVVELRRAEVKLIYAAVVNTHYRDLRSKSAKDRPRSKEASGPSIPSKLSSTEVSKIRGSLGDIRRSLVRVERLLSNHLTSLWWRQIHAVLSLKWFEYHIFMMAADDRGIKDGPPVFPEIDMNVFRNHDLLQLARALDCCSAIVWILRKSKFTESAKPAQDKARELAKNLEHFLRQALETAEQADSTRPDDLEIDEGVRKYAAFVHKGASAVLNR